jgi:hypothetical protein
VVKGGNLYFQTRLAFVAPVDLGPPAAGPAMNRPIDSFRLSRFTDGPVARPEMMI